MPASRSIVIGSRGSPLALAQTDLVRTALMQARPDLRAQGAVTVQVIKTSGDRILDRPLADVGGKGLFTKEIDEAMLAGAIDLAVHSMKDVPTVLPEGLIIAAMLPREDPRDVLLGGFRSLLDMPEGSVLGTASLRRAAQARHRRPDLKVVSLRGNVQTRLRKLRDREVDATLLAAAGLRRLGLNDHGGVHLEIEEMLPAVAQGAVGIQVRADDAELVELLHEVDHEPTSRCVRTERAFLAELDGSCHTPIAALARADASEISVQGLIVSPDGRALYEDGERGAREQGEEVARRIAVGLRERAGPGFFDALT